MLFALPRDDRALGADGSVFGLSVRPNHRTFPEQLSCSSGMSHRRKVEGDDAKQLSSPVTAAGQRRIFTGLPMHPSAALFHDLRS